MYTSSWRSACELIGTDGSSSADWQSNIGEWPAIDEGVGAALLPTVPLWQTHTHPYTHFYYLIVVAPADLAHDNDEETTMAGCDWTSHKNKWAPQTKVTVYNCTTATSYLQ